MKAKGSPPDLARGSHGTGLPDGVPDLTSVLVVNFNAGQHLVACVASVLGSTAPVEVLVIDNGSIDHSLASLRRSLDAGEARVRIIENGANLGFAAASNRGLRAARGGWLLFLNPDCVLESTTIAEMRTQMTRHPDAGMAGCLVLNPDGTEQAGCRREQPTPGKALVRALGVGELLRRGRIGGGVVRDFVRQGDPLPAEAVELDAISGAFMFVRREALLAVGPLDEGYFLHCEDLDWCERFRRQRWKILFVPHVSVVHAKGVSSADRPVRVLWHMHRGMIRYYRKFLRDRYPALLLWMVAVGVWLRFGILAGRAAARRLLSGLRGLAGDETRSEGG